MVSSIQSIGIRLWVDTGYVQQKVVVWFSNSSMVGDGIKSWRCGIFHAYQPLVHQPPPAYGLSDESHSLYEYWLPTMFLAIVRDTLGHRYRMCVCLLFAFFVWPASTVIRMFFVASRTRDCRALKIRVLLGGAATTKCVCKQSSGCNLECFESLLVLFFVPGFGRSLTARPVRQIICNRIKYKNTFFNVQSLLNEIPYRENRLFCFIISTWGPKTAVNCPNPLPAFYTVDCLDKIGLSLRSSQNKAGVWAVEVCSSRRKKRIVHIWVFYTVILLVWVFTSDCSDKSCVGSNIFVFMPKN